MLAASLFALCLAAGPIDGQDLSLEQLLAKARAAEAAAQGPIRERVAAILEELGTSDLRESNLKALQQELLALGPPAGPLLVPGLDPGEGPKPKLAHRADRLEPVLVAFQDLGTTLALLEVAVAPNTALADRALKVLRESPHDRVVAETLAPKIDWERPLETSRAYLRTICALKGKAASLPLHQALEARKRSQVVAAIIALTYERNALVGPELLQVLQSLPDYTVFVAVLRYFEALPETLVAGEDLRIALLQAATQVPRPQVTSLEPWEQTFLATDLPQLAPDMVVELLAAPIAIKGTTALREVLWDWVERHQANESQLLVLLGKLGDNKAKKRYLERANERVQTTRREDEAQQATALSERARAYLDLGDDANALRDGLKALKLAEKKPPVWTVRQELSITLGTVQALRGRLKEAAEFLEAAGLNSVQRKTLRKLPAFGEFLKSRYGYLLEP